MSEKINFFNIPEEKAVVRPLLEEKAKELGLVINPFMEHKIIWSEAHGGRCMCDWKERKCPCDEILNDLVNFSGQCLCKVLVTKEKMKKIKKEQKTKNKKKVKNKKQKSTKEQTERNDVKIKEAKILAKKLGCKDF